MRWRVTSLDGCTAYTRRSVVSSTSPGIPRLPAVPVYRLFTSLPIDRNKAAAPRLEHPPHRDDVRADDESEKPRDAEHLGSVR